MILEYFLNANKTGKVKTLFKKRLKADPTKYRPKYPLTLLFKFFQRVVLDQTKMFLRRSHLTISLVLGKITQEKDRCLSFSNDKILKVMMMFY